MARVERYQDGWYLVGAPCGIDRYRTTSTVRRRTRIPVPRDVPRHWAERVAVYNGMVKAEDLEG